jgi:3-oxoacyl-[acyl-carrier protein] reductase
MSFESQDRLDGKVVVIAGGKGAIGMASAIRLAARGARIVSLDRSESDAVQAQLKALPGAATAQHFAVTASITDGASLVAAAAVVKERAGRCDILINSAGHTKAVPAGDLEGLSDALFDDIMQANLRGVFSTIRAFAPMLKASGDGLIVNVSSIAGFTGNGSNLAYVASKAGLDVLTKSLAKALAPQVPARAPGARAGRVARRGGFQLCTRARQRLQQQGRRHHSAGTHRRGGRYCRRHRGLRHQPALCHRRAFCD